MSAAQDSLPSTWEDLAEQYESHAKACAMMARNHGYSPRLHAALHADAADMLGTAATFRSNAAAGVPLSPALAAIYSRA